MRTLPWLGLFTSLTAIAFSLAACGTSDGIGGPTTVAASTSPAACTGAMECNPDQCVCNDGDTAETPTICLEGSCGQGSNDSFCASVCQSHGGVKTIEPHPNVATSAECDAWCAKGASLACGSTTCDRFFFCGVDKGSCEAAKRAALQCEVDKGTWACSEHGNSWSVGAPCPTFKELCTDADAGSH
jgi:hypothetical protein